jgi:hypothetical protein
VAPHDATLHRHHQRDLWCVGRCHSRRQHKGVVMMVIVMILIMNTMTRMMMMMMVMITMMMVMMMMIIIIMMMITTRHVPCVGRRACGRRGGPPWPAPSPPQATATPGS